MLANNENKENINFTGCLESPEKAISLSREFITQENLVDAQTCVEKSLKIFPKNYDLSIMQSRIFAWQKKYDLALRELDGIPQTYEVFYTQGDIYWYMENCEKSIESYEQSIKLKSIDDIPKESITSYAKCKLKIDGISKNKNLIEQLAKKYPEDQWLSKQKARLLVKQNFLKVIFQPNFFANYQKFDNQSTRKIFAFGSDVKIISASKMEYFLGIKRFHIEAIFQDETKLKDVGYTFNAGIGISRTIIFNMQYSNTLEADFNYVKYLNVGIDYYTKDLLLSYLFRDVDYLYSGFESHVLMYKYFVNSLNVGNKVIFSKFVEDKTIELQLLLGSTFFDPFDFQLWKTVMSINVQSDKSFRSTSDGVILKYIAQKNFKPYFLYEFVRERETSYNSIGVGVIWSF